MWLVWFLPWGRCLISPPGAYRPWADLTWFGQAGGSPRAASSCGLTLPHSPVPQERSAPSHSARSLTQGWKPAANAAVPPRWHFLNSRWTDGASYLISSGPSHHSDISSFCLSLYRRWQTTKHKLIVLSAHASDPTESGDHFVFARGSPLARPVCRSAVSLPPPRDQGRRRQGLRRRSKGWGFRVSLLPEIFKGEQLKMLKQLLRHFPPTHSV